MTRSAEQAVLVGARIPSHCDINAMDTWRFGAAMPKDDLNCRVVWLSSIEHSR
jgi:hypothetical protein